MPTQPPPGPSPSKPPPPPPSSTMPLGVRIKLAIAIVAVALAVLLALQNFGLVNQGIPARILFWTLNVPLALVVVLAAAVGFVLGLLVASRLFGRKR